MAHIPDGGYGWFVVLGSFITNFLLAGIGRTFGIQMNIITMHYNTSSSLAAFIGALSSGIRSLGGPLASYLLSKMDGRIVVMFGGLLVALSFVISTFVPSAYYLVGTYSILGGFGGCLVYTPSYVIINQYFDKNRGKALGLATVGAGIGTAALAPIIIALESEYGYSGGMCVIGALALNLCVAGALFRPLHKNKLCKTSSYQTDQPIQSNELKVMRLRNHFLQVTYQIKSAIDKKVKQPDTKKLIPDEMDTKERINKQLVVESLTTRSFVIYCVHMMSMPLCISSYIIWLPYFSTELGYTPQMGAWLVSLYGVCDIIGRLGGGIIFDIDEVRTHKRLCHTAVGLGLSVTVMCSGIVYNYWVVVVVIALNGILEGAFHSQRTSILSTILPDHLASRAMGILIFCQGIGTFCGPITGGLLFDNTHTCRWTFLMNGGVFCFTSLIFLIDARTTTPTDESDDDWDQT